MLSWLLFKFYIIYKYTKSTFILFSPAGKAASPLQGKGDGGQSQTPSPDKRDDREDMVTPASMGGAKTAQSARPR